MPTPEEYIASRGLTLAECTPPALKGSALSADVKINTWFEATRDALAKGCSLRAQGLEARQEKLHEQLQALHAFSPALVADFTIAVPGLAMHAWSYALDLAGTARADSEIARALSQHGSRHKALFDGEQLHALYTTLLQSKAAVMSNGLHFGVAAYLSLTGQHPLNKQQAIGVGTHEVSTPAFCRVLSQTGQSTDSPGLTLEACVAAGRFLQPKAVTPKARALADLIAFVTDPRAGANALLVAGSPQCSATWLDSAVHNGAMLGDVVAAFYTPEVWACRLYTDRNTPDGKTLAELVPDLVLRFLLDHRTQLPADAAALVTGEGPAPTDWRAPKMTLSGAASTGQLYWLAAPDTALEKALESMPAHQVNPAYFPGQSAVLEAAKLRESMAEQLSAGAPNPAPSQDQPQAPARRRGAAL